MEACGAWSRPQKWSCRHGSFSGDEKASAALQEPPNCTQESVLPECPCRNSSRSHTGWRDETFGTCNARRTAASLEAYREPLPQSSSHGGDMAAILYGIFLNEHPLSSHFDGEIEVGRMKPTRKRRAGEQATPHRVIEKRRRDRINRSLDELRAMVPAARRAQGVKNDKVDLLQMTIEYLKLVQNHGDSIKNGDCNGNHSEKENDEIKSSDDELREKISDFPFQLSPNDVMLTGFKECAEEAIRFLVEEEHLSPDHPLVARLSAHLKKLQGTLEFNTAMQEHTSIFSFSRSDAPALPHQETPRRQCPVSDQGPLPPLHVPQPQRTLPATTLGELRIDTGPLYTVAPGHPRSTERLPAPTPITPSAARLSSILSPASSTSSSTTVGSPTAPSLTPMYAYVPRYAYPLVPQIYLASPPAVTSPVAQHPHTPAVAAGSASSGSSPYVMAWLPHSNAQ